MAVPIGRRRVHVHSYKGLQTSSAGKLGYDNADCNKIATAIFFLNCSMKNFTVHLRYCALSNDIEMQIASLLQWKYFVTSFPKRAHLLNMLQHEFLVNHT